jgi:hypothetical protein
MEEKMKRFIPLKVIVAILTGIFILSGTLAARQLPKEEKIYIYIICDRSLKSQATFSKGFFNAFTKLGFSDQMRLAGITWVEADYRKVGDITGFLEIGRDDLVYLGVVSTDRHGQIVRELCRERYIVDSAMDQKEIWAAAEQKCHKFYYAVRETLENLKKPQEKKRQKAMMDPYDQKTLSIKVTLAGKNIASLGGRPYIRENVDVVMVPSSQKLWKAMGITSATESRYRDGKRLVLKRGKKRLVFEARGEMEKGKIYVLDYSANPPSRTYILPVQTDFAYPELQAGTLSVPLKLVVNVLMEDRFTFNQTGLDEAVITRKDR